MWSDVTAQTLRAEGGVQCPVGDSIEVEGRHPRLIVWLASVLVALRTLGPGAVLTAVLAVGATLLGHQVPVVRALVIAILTGVVVSLIRQPSARLRPGIAFASRQVLQTSIVVLGTGLSLGQVLSTGARSLPVLVGTLVAALGMAWVAGRLLGLRGDLRTLIGIGTAICGASAIAATDAVIDADEADMS